MHIRQVARRGVKGRAFNASRFTCRFVEKLPISGARVTILQWVITDTIASFAVNSLSGGMEALFPPLRIYVPSPFTLPSGFILLPLSAFVSLFSYPFD